MHITTTGYLQNLIDKSCATTIAFPFREYVLKTNTEFNTKTNSRVFFQSNLAAEQAVFCLKEGDAMQHFKNLIKLSSSLHFSAMSHYKSMGFQYMDVPAIVGITGSCENVDTLFKIKSRIDAPLYFT